MKSKRIQPPQILDIKALGQLHNNIIGKIGQLDKLTQEFKVKQEHHFLKTFMGVLQRMGNDLILAQQAYRNIDIEIKRQKYYQEIAAQLTFYKGQCFVLKKENLQLKQHIQDIKLDNQTLQNEINSIKSIYQRKVNQASQLKDKVSLLRKKIRTDILIDKSQHKFTTPDKNSPFCESVNQAGQKQDQLFEKKEIVAQRWIQTQQIQRRKMIAGKSSQAFENTPNTENEVVSRYHPSAGSKYRSTQNTFRRLSQEKSKRTGSPLFD